MNIEKEILKEHSKANTVKIADYIGADTERFDELIQLFLNGEYRVTQRSAWIMSECIERNPFLIGPYIKMILKNLNNPVHDAVKRNTLRILQFVRIPEDLQGLAVDLCFNFLNSASEPIAVKVFAMSVLDNICKEQPDLKSELKAVIRPQLPFASAGFISRAKKILKG